MADTKGAHQAERRQQLLMKTPRQLHWKPSFQVSWNSILSMNGARVITYEQVRSEVQAYIDARRSQFAFKTVAAKGTSDPMDVDSFGRGGKKGEKGKKRKGNGKGQNQSQNPNPSKDVVCWLCGKKGHLSTECWSNPENQSGSGRIPNKGGKG